MNLRCELGAVRTARATTSLPVPVCPPYVTTEEAAKTPYGLHAARRAGNV